MTTKSQIDKALTAVLYSVIEKGVCRIVTCQQPKLLDQLKSVYAKNLPDDHSILWLPGKIESIEQLSWTLSEAGVPDIKSGCDRYELIEQIRAYLIFCQQQHRLEIWVFEDAELLSSEIYQLLGELVNAKYSTKGLLSFELWGGAQLDVSYHSGLLKACCCAQYYYIPLGKQVLLAERITKVGRAAIIGILIFVLGMAVGNRYLYWPNQQELLQEVAAPAETFPKQSKSSIDDIANSVAIDIVKSDIDPLMINIIEQVPELNVKDTSMTSDSLLSTDNANNRHWFYSLYYSQWREKYQISLLDDINRQEGLFYLQLGIYKKKESLSKFFDRKVFPAKTYYFCYLEKDKRMALMTGSYTSAYQAYNAHDELLADGFTSMVVSQSQLNQWQCSN